MKKKGQATIFIVISILVFVAILIIIFLFFVENPKIDNDPKEENPKYFLEECLEKDLREIIEDISLKGGFIEGGPPKINFQFYNEPYREITYLCYNRQNYVPCENQVPLLIQHLKKEIKNNINESVEECFRDYVSNLEKEGYKVKENYQGFEIILEKGFLILDIEGKLGLTKGEESTNQENMKLNYRSSLYDLAFHANEIIYQEAIYCNFNRQGYILSNKGIHIRSITREFGKIYEIEDIQSQDKFRFAIRSCIIPPLN